MQWLDAIRVVLQAATGPIHYTDIAQQIIDRGLRPEGIGATPATTVNGTLRSSIRNDGANSPFMQVGPGQYAWKEAQAEVFDAPADDVEEVVTSSQITGIVNAFGMFWERSKVLWINNPKIFGQQQIGSTEVDFCDEKGVYLLHDSQGVVYAGRATDHRRSGSSNRGRPSRPNRPYR